MVSSQAEYRTGQFHTRVIEARSLTPTIRAIRLSKPPGFVFHTSQAAMLLVPTPLGTDWRPMSIASAPTRSYLEFAARLSDSPFKQAFVALEPGTMVTIRGPVGHFFLDTGRPAILVAGGTGITPLKSMAEYATDCDIDIPLTLLYANHSPSEIAYRDELNELRSANPRLEIIHTVTRAVERRGGRTGRIDAQLLRQTGERHKDPIFYTAGPTSRVHSIKQALIELGITLDCIRFEQFHGYR
jgi:ferredoxin-NADP reductase